MAALQDVVPTEKVTHNEEVFPETSLSQLSQSMTPSVTNANLQECNKFDFIGRSIAVHMIRFRPDGAKLKPFVQRAIIYFTFGDTQIIH